MKNEFLKTKSDIMAWLKKYKVANYTLVEDPTYSYVVNVAGEVILSDKKLQSIPVKFNRVSKTFNCSNNQLTSLEFCPTVAEGNFYCYDNKLTSLKFCPEHIGGSFNCSGNQLTSLEFCPTRVEISFSCDDNQIASLEFCPQIVGGTFYCYNNPALGDSQDIKSFADILSIHQEIVRIKKEKENIEKSLGKANNSEILSNKSVLKI